MKEYSDNYLNQLWRKAVLILYDNKCFFCGKSINEVELECHHIVKRKTLLLRWDYRNGIPVCKWHRPGLQMSCHQYADTPAGRNEIYNRVPIVGEYFNSRLIPFKQWLVDKGITKAEFKNLMYNELKEIIDKKI